MHLTPLQTALAEPLPEALAAAIATADAAREAYATAEAAREDFEREPLKADAETAESALHAALASRDVAARIGDGAGPSAKEVDALQKKRDAAVAARDGRTDRVRAFAAEIDRRRAALSEASGALDTILRAWRDRVLKAADLQLAEAVRLAGEAEKVADAVSPLYGGRDQISRPRIHAAGHHDGPTRFDLPEPAASAIEAWFRAFRSAR